MATKIADLFLRISAKNETGDAFNRLAEQIDGKMVGSVTRGVLQANLLTAGFNTLAGAAQQAIGSIQSGIAEATNIQLEQINAATTFASLTGKKYEEAVVVIENLNNRLAKSAATLPGATQDYKQLATTIQDNVLEAFKGINGEVDLQGFEDTVSSISESYGALTAASTKMTGNTALGLTKALSGGSVNELRTIAFFEQNPVILNEIEKRLQQLGAKSLRDLDIKTRVKLLEEVGKKFITEDFKKQAAESVDGLIQGFKSTLFDPSSGIFGLMRDLDPSKKGTQSAFTAYNETLKALIGESGILGSKGPLAAIASALNISDLTYLNTVQSAFQRATTGIQAIGKFLFGIASALESGVNLRDVALQNLGNIRDRVGSFVGNLLNSAGDGLTRALGQGASFLEQAPIGELLASVFNGLVDGFSKMNMAGIASEAGRFFVALINQLAKLLANIDVGKMIDVAFMAIGAVIAGIGAAMAKADWTTIITATFKVLGVLAIAAMVQSGPALIAMGLQFLVANLLRALAVQALYALVSLGASSLFAGGIINAIGVILAGIVAAIGAIPLAIGLAVVGLIAIIIFKWNDIKAVLSAALDVARNFLTVSIPQALIMMIAGIFSFFSWIGGVLSAKFNEIKSWVEGKANEAINAITGLFGMIVNRIKGMIPGAQQSADTANSNIGGTLKNLPNAGGWQNIRSGGQIPTAFAGLLGAIGQEMSGAPPGSRPVIANSSEFILRPSQAQAFAAGAAMGGGGRNYTFSPTINLAAGTPESHAQEILRYFEIWLSEHQQASLA